MGLLVAMKLFEEDKIEEYNFEMVYDRFQKFARDEFMSVTKPTAFAVCLILARTTRPAHAPPHTHTHHRTRTRTTAHAPPHTHHRTRARDQRHTHSRDTAQAFESLLEQELIKKVARRAEETATPKGFLMVRLMPIPAQIEAVLRDPVCLPFSLPSSCSHASCRVVSCRTVCRVPCAGCRVPCCAALRSACCRRAW